MIRDWTLSYLDTVYPFGTEATDAAMKSLPEEGGYELTTQDRRRPRGDGLAVGQDTIGGKTLVFDLWTTGRDYPDGRAKLGRLERAWRADDLRQTPGAVAELTTENGLTAYGRPRRFQPDKKHLVRTGVTYVDADFLMVDPNWYGDETRLHIGFVPELGGGLVSPLVAPLSTTATSNRSRDRLDVAGDGPTPLVFTIHGPITNPVVELVGHMRFEFDISLAYDESLTLDARPWRRTIRVNGSPVAGTLSRTSTRLANALVPPGAYEVVLRGASDTATASLDLSVRSAHASY